MLETTEKSNELKTVSVKKELGFWKSRPKSAKTKVFPKEQ